MPTFRVHFPGGYLDVIAANPSDAREKAKAERPGEVVTKVKVLR